MNKRTVTVLGLNQSRLLNKIFSEGITLFNINKISQSKLRFSLCAKDVDKAIAIIQKMCYNYEVGGKDNFVKKALKRIWLPIAAVVFLLLIFMSNQLVWGVEITGSSGIALVNVQRLINERGIKPFALKPKDLTVLEAEIMSLSNITHAAVKLSGNILKIEVIESQVTTPLDGGGSVVSGFDGVVTRVVTESGTPLVRRGDVVKKGQSLISGDLTASADGRITVSAQPKGSVYGTVCFSFSTIVTDGYSWAETGNVQAETALSVFGWKWNGNDCGFGSYNSVTIERDFFFFKFSQIVYREIALEAISGDIAAYSKKILDSLESIYMTAFDAKYITEEKGGLTLLRLYCTAEMCLGES